MDPKNVEPTEALKETRPKTVSKVRKLLGFLVTTDVISRILPA